MAAAQTEEEEEEAETVRQSQEILTQDTAWVPAADYSNHSTHSQHSEGQFVLIRHTAPAAVYSAHTVSGGSLHGLLRLPRVVNEGDVDVQVAVVVLVGLAHQLALDGVALAAHDLVRDIKHRLFPYSVS